MLKRLTRTHGQDVARPHTCAFSEAAGEVTLTLSVPPSQRAWHLALTGAIGGAGDAPSGCARDAVLTVSVCGGAPRPPVSQTSIRQL